MCSITKSCTHTEHNHTQLLRLLLSYLLASYVWNMSSQSAWTKLLLYSSCFIFFWQQSVLCWSDPFCCVTVTNKQPGFRSGADAATRALWWTLQVLHHPLLHSHCLLCAGDGVVPLPAGFSCVLYLNPSGLLQAPQTRPQTEANNNNNNSNSSIVLIETCALPSYQVSAT